MFWTALLARLGNKSQWSQFTQTCCNIYQPLHNAVHCRLISVWLALAGLLLLLQRMQWHQVAGLEGKKGFKVQGKKKCHLWETCMWRVHMWACLFWLREIQPRTPPGFIPSDHVHPLFISLTHSPWCRNMIPMSSPTLSPDNPPLPHHSSLYLGLPSCFLLLWIMEG